MLLDIGLDLSHEVRNALHGATAHCLLSDRCEPAFHLVEAGKIGRHEVQMIPGPGGQVDGMPEQLNTPGKRAWYNNLNQNEELALKIDEPVRRLDPTIFVVFKQTLLPLLGNGPGEVEHIDPVVVPATGNRPTKVYRCCRPGTSCQAASLRVTDRVGPPN